MNIIDMTKCGDLFHIDRHGCLVEYWFDSTTGGITDSQIFHVLYPNEEMAIAMTKFKIKSKQI